MCAVCHFAAVPAVRHIVWLTQRSGIARVHVGVLLCQQTCFCNLRPLVEQRVHRRFMMEFIADAGAAQTTSTGSCEHEKGAQGLKVRACMRTLSLANDSAICSLACQRGCLWLTGDPHLIPIFYGDHSRTPGSLERRAP